jgi:hypothetical protein
MALFFGVKKFFCFSIDHHPSSLLLLQTTESNMFFLFDRHSRTFLAGIHAGQGGTADKWNERR